jgi:hypothetical protein
MTPDDLSYVSESLQPLKARYPTKTHYLSQVFKNTTNSYKFFWFLGLLNLIKNGEGIVVDFDDILREMVMAAWYPVCFYRLSFGQQDKLQHVVAEIRATSGLPPRASLRDIRSSLESSPGIQSKLAYFARYVPSRFLVPWFAKEIRNIQQAEVRTKEIECRAAQIQYTSSASIYIIEGNNKEKRVRIDESWHAFIYENLGVVEAFARHHLSLYLQSRNPNVPGIVSKLQIPVERQLTFARKFWLKVRTEFAEESRQHLFRDIYADVCLDDVFSIDHFLPWSFVTHDQLWNLAPVDKATNSKKGDSIPDLDLYLPRLTELHRQAILIMKNRPKLLEEYLDCFREDALGLLSLSKDAFARKYREVILPQAQIAINQGFEAGWTF